MKLFDLLFPKRCLGCNTLGSYLCSQCINWLKIVEKQICPMCGQGSVGGKTHFGCTKPLGMDGVLSTFKYQGVAKRIVTKIKYKKVTDLFSTLVDLMISLGYFAPLERTHWNLVAVPLHKTRLKKRGFNQSEILASKLAGYFNWDHTPNALIRTKNTPPQINFKGKKRRLNVQNTFALKPNTHLSGKNILLIDDVWTTGATMRECAQVLKRAGAKKVWGLAFAS